METTPASRADIPTRRMARHGLSIYFAVVVVLSAPIQAVIIYLDLDGGANGMVPWLVLITGLMFVPTVASMAARFTLKEGFADVSFRFGGRRGRNAILQALVFPVVIGLVAYCIAWTTGLVGFGPPPLSQWAVIIIVFLILNLILVSGEEIGWRGYMLTRLIDAGVPRPVLASGLIWGLWHVPLVLWAGFADGPSPLLSTALLMVTTTSLGYVLARMRLETGASRAARGLERDHPDGVRPGDNGRRENSLGWRSGDPYRTHPGRGGRDLLARAMDDDPQSSQTRESPRAASWRPGPTEGAMTGLRVAARECERVTTRDASVREDAQYEPKRRSV